MSYYVFATLQGAIVVGFFVIFLFLEIRWILRKRMKSSLESRESPETTLYWFDIADADTGILEVSLATTALAQGLYAFTAGPQELYSRVLIFYQLLLFFSGVLGACATFWLYLIYIRQIKNRERSQDTANFRDFAAMKIHENSKFIHSHRLLNMSGGPYGLLGVSIALLIIGFSLMPFIL